MFEQDLVEPGWVHDSFRVFIHMVVVFLLIGMLSCGMFYWVLIPAAGFGFVVGFGRAGFARSGRWVWVAPLLFGLWWIFETSGGAFQIARGGPEEGDLEIVLFYAPLTGLIVYGLAVNAGFTVSQRVRNQASESRSRREGEGFEHEIVTEQLPSSDIWERLDWMIEYLRRREVSQVELMYGVGMDMDNDEMFQPIEAAIEEVVPRIEEMVRSGVLTVGNGDIFIQSDAAGVQFHLCHESDIHVRTRDAERLQEISSEWQASGIRYTLRSD